ncbi:hypothetical protein ACW73L_05770 [Methylolobus aquaticus]|nr:hypothetical protein EWI61_08455 [Methylolobus aquaticus]
MNPCHCHPDHEHQHGAHCGHTAIQHAGHVDYLHDGHLHHPHMVDGKVAHYDEHRLDVSSANPEGCVDTTAACCGTGHRHGPGCGHEAVPHGDHIDYLVDGILHHPCGDHCDRHGPVHIVSG